MSALRTWARQRGLGRIAYRLIHQPSAQFDLARTYGWRLACQAWRGSIQMRRAATALPPLPLPSLLLAAPVCFLTGHRFIHQTMFCAHSFARWSPLRASFVFLSDGSLTADQALTLRQNFPGATVLDGAAQDLAVAAALPPEKFPGLHALRPKFVLLRKLTDAMAGRRGYRLFFDSDMLFWREPSELLARVTAVEPLYMADIGDDGYTVSRTILAGKFGVPVAAGVNSGLVGLTAERIDWELLERACAFLLESQGDRRLLEQTLWAVVLGAQTARPLDAHTYRTVIDPLQWAKVREQESSPALLHYAWHARLPYTAGEWRRYLKESAA